MERGEEEGGGEEEEEEKEEPYQPTPKPTFERKTIVARRASDRIAAKGGDPKARKGETDRREKTKPRKRQATGDVQVEAAKKNKMDQGTLKEIMDTLKESERINSKKGTLWWR